MIADSQHVALLRQGPRPWNEWRSANPAAIPNLVGISLSIGDRQLGPINGGPIDLSHARLRHAVLRFATLTGADLNCADLADADLRDARLEGANLCGADLSDACLDRADFSGTSLTGANLCGASLAEARGLTSAQLHEAEGDAATVLPAHLERPLIWTVTHVVDRQSVIARPTPRRRDEKPKKDQGEAQEDRKESQRPQRGERVSWLIGGPRTEGRTQRPGAPFGDSRSA